MDESILPVKRKRGRPKGSKNDPNRQKKPPSPGKIIGKEAWDLSKNNLVDPETGVVVNNSGGRAVVLGRMGDERVSAFVRYHIECLKMREGCDKRNVPDLYQRFYRYLAYCEAHGVIPNNMNCYLAIGVTMQDMSEWRLGKRGTPEHRQFVQDVSQFFASIHEQGAADGILNPISSIFWQKAHDGMIEAAKVEMVHTDPLGEKKSAEEIAKSYTNLPD